MPTSKPAREVFERDFPALRARLLDLAAALDRLGRAPGQVANLPEYQQVQAALAVLARPDDDRAEQVQLIFSRPYAMQWRQQLGV